MPKPIINTVFKGTNREFTGSLTEIAEHFNINYSTFYSRLKQGFSLEKAIDCKDKRRKIITVFKGTNREFIGNYKQIAEHFNINYNIFKSRLYQGYTPEEIIDWDGGKFKNYTVFKGTNKEFTGNIKELADRFNIKYSKLQDRIHKCDTIEECLDEKSRKYEIYTVFKDTNKEFTGNIRELAEHFNIKYGTFYTRLKTGYSPEEAIDLGSSKNKFYTIFKNTSREFTGNKKEIAEHFNINYSTFVKRLKQGYSPEEAIEIYLDKVRINNLSYKDFKGNLREICQHFNKDYTEVYNKLRYNHTLEWSIESTKEPYVDE